MPVQRHRQQAPTSHNDSAVSYHTLRPISQRSKLGDRLVEDGAGMLCSETKASERSPDGERLMRQRLVSGLRVFSASLMSIVVAWSMSPLILPERAVALEQPEAQH